MPTTDQKIDELAQMVARGFQDVQSQVDAMEKKMATKADMDVMLDRHIGTFRKDYDELASRVKKPEELVLAR